MDVSRGRRDLPLAEREKASREAQNEGKCMVRERGAKACLCYTTRKTSKTREVRFGNEWMPVLGGKMATSRGLETGQRREKRNRITQVSHHMLSVRA